MQKTVMSLPLTEPTVFYVDDDEAMCESVRFLIESVNLKVKIFLNAKDFS